MEAVKAALRLEELRKKAAKVRDYKTLKLLYEKNLSEIFNSNTDSFWNEKLEHELSFPMADDRNKWILKKLQNSTGKLIELGFGNAELLKKIQKNNNLSLYGIDISSYAVYRARKKLKGVFKKTSITKIPFKSNYFDIVLVLEVMEHVSPSKTFGLLKEVNRVLKSNGILIVSVPLNEGLKEMLFKNENPNAHVRFYSPELIIIKLEMSGFIIKEKKLLYAFSRLYNFKKFLQKWVLIKQWKPNNVILIAEKK